MNTLDITEYHNSNPEVIIKQFEIRKQQLLAEYSDKISNFILHWVGNTAYLSGVASYSGYTVNFKGNIIVTGNTVRIVIENDLSSFLYTMGSSFIEDKIRQEIRTMMQIPLNY